MIYHIRDPHLHLHCDHDHQWVSYSHFVSSFHQHLNASQRLVCLRVNLYITVLQRLKNYELVYVQFSAGVGLTVAH